MSMRSAFTLIELAIVMVIIGLIAGGVLVGKDMIHAGQIQQQVRQFGGFDEGVLTFRMKYDALPGDLLASRATSLGFSNYGGSNGDGALKDDLGNLPLTRLWEETYYFFIQLSEARLVPGQYRFTAGHYNFDTQFPRGKIGRGGIIAYTTNTGKLAYYFGISQGTTTASSAADSNISVLSTQGIITPEQAQRLDVKLDDGYPGSGGVRPVTNTSTYDTTNSSCIVSTAANQYNFTNTNMLCRLMVTAQQ